VNSYADEDTLTVDNTDPAPQTRQDAWESRLQFNVIFHEKPGLKTLIEAGVNAQVLFYRFMEKEWQDDSGLVPLIQVDGTSASFKVFVQYQRKFSDSFTFDAGLNALCFAYNGKFSLDPRVSARWQINGSHSVSAGTGIFSQLPEDMFYFVETELEDGTVILTNKGMGYMRSFHFVLGYDYLIAENLRLKTEAYYQHLFNIPVRETEPAYSMLNFGDDSFSSIPIIDSLVNQGTGNNLGIELTVEKFLARGYYFLFTGALFSSRYKGYDGITRHTAFDKNFTLNLLGGKEFCIRKKNFLNIDLKLTWAGGMRYVPFHTQQVSEHYYIRIDDWENAYEERRPDYFRLNIRLSYRINLRRATFEIALDMLNVTNQKNIYFEFFDPSTGEIQTVYQLPFIPVPLIRLQF
jgi:hypothetical protein